MESLEALRLNFSPSSLYALNAVLAVVMFGVALDMRVADFKRVLTAGKGVAIGLGVRILLFPAFTYLLVVALGPSPAIALGLFLVAACPGGNMSNFLTHHARGDTALSVTITAVSSAASCILTPLILAFWGGLYPPTREILREVSVSPIDMAGTVVLILAIPLALGMTLAERRPAFAERLRKPMNRFSMVAFGILVLAAVAGNLKAFLPYLPLVGGLVLLHNGGGFLMGYLVPAAFRLPEIDRRAVSLEVGMQNAGLGLILVFAHFDGNGAMAIIAAWWGVWHLISGFILASWWRRREPKS